MNLLPIFFRIPKALPLMSLITIVAYSKVHAGPMSTPFQFRVNELGGSTFTLPIKIPPGTAGISPSVAITYNSLDGNGIVGVGGDLSATSAITRCPQTLISDGARNPINHDGNDRFCLDGQRLIAVSGAYGASGTEYRTEISNFSKIVSYGSTSICRKSGVTTLNEIVSPSYFKVWSKSGRISTFGNTPDSNIKATGLCGESIARAWALNRVQDSHGNYMNFTYVNDSQNQDFYPTRIDYTGNETNGMAADNSVRFEYEPRPDFDFSYRGAGVNTRRKVRLLSVRTFAGADEVKNYGISYKVSAQTARSQIASIAECDRAAIVCLPPINFDWSVQADGAAMERWSTAEGSFIRSGYNLATLSLSGRSDILGIGVHPTYGNGLNFTAFVSDGKAYKPQATTIADRRTGIWSGEYGGINEKAGTEIAWLIMDANGDQIADVVKIGSVGDSISIELYETFMGRTIVNNYVTPQMWFDGKFSYQPNNNLFGNRLSKAGKFLAGDSQVINVFNDGTGKVAIDTYRINNERAFYLSSTTRNSSVSTTGPWDPSQRWFVRDINGDGLADLFAVRNDAGSATIDVYERTESGFTYRAWEVKSGGFWDSQNWLLGDVNGDGLLDLINVFDDRGMVSVDVHINTGKSFVRERWLTNSSKYSNNQRWLVGDVNGDGRADLLNVYNDGGYATTYVGISTGVGFIYKSWEVKAGQYFDEQNWMVGDPKGQGNSSLINLFKNDSMRASIDVHASNPPGDQVIRISTGLGDNYAVKYALLDDEKINTSYDNGRAPFGPSYAVSSFTAPDGIGGEITIKYNYKKINYSVSRGILGFSSIKATQVESGLISEIQYGDEFPYNTIPLKIIKSTVDGKVLSTVINTPACKNLNGEVCAFEPGKIYFPHVKKTEIISRDLNGAVLAPSSVTLLDYDNFGNAIKISTSSNDANGGYITTTVNDYANDADNWIIGRLKRSTITKVTP